ncbi:MAG: ABC transporter substrate-binding protein [Leptolyngbya sp. SIO4C1]|nr:ABC transporter substrate-binding protein [Leptolyngbya sp. SIO4C1]
MTLLIDPLKQSHCYLRRFSKRFSLSLAVWFILSFALALIVGGCAFGTAKPTPLRVGMNSWPGYALSLYAQSEGLFKQRGLDVELVQFINQQDNIAATMRGTIDASFVPLWEVMQLETGDSKPAFVMVADVSAGADGIVARPEITRIEDLKGKKIGVKLGTVTHLVLLEALQSAQLTSSDVELVNVSNEIGIQRLKDSKLDAAVVWEPALSATAQAVDGNVIFTTADVDSLVIDGLAARADYIEANQAVFTQFILAWLDAIYAVETNPNEVFSVIGQQIDQSASAFATDYAGLQKGDLEMNRRMFESGRLSEAIQQVKQLLETNPQYSQFLEQEIVVEPTPMINAIQQWSPPS